MTTDTIIPVHHFAKKYRSEMSDTQGWIEGKDQGNGFRVFKYRDDLMVVFHPSKGECMVRDYRERTPRSNRGGVSHHHQQLVFQQQQQIAAQHVQHMQQIQHQQHMNQVHMQNHMNMF